MQYKWFFNKYSQYEILDQTEDWLYCKKKANLQVNFEKNFWDTYLNKNKAQYELTPEILQFCPFLNKIASCVSCTISWLLVLKSSVGCFHTNTSFGPSYLIIFSISNPNAIFIILQYCFIVCRFIKLFISVS